MKDIMSEFEFYALYTGKRELCYLAQTHCLSGGSQIWWLLKLRGQKESVSNKENSPLPSVTL